MDIAPSVKTQEIGSSTLGC